MDYRRAPEIEEVARELIEEHHEVLRDHEPRIEYVMVRASGKTDPPNWRMRKVAGVQAFLASGRSEEWGSAVEPIVVVEVAWWWWAILDEEQRAGFVDHCLHHLRCDFEKGTWSIEGPEFGEFRTVLERHGFWRPGKAFQKFAATVSEQLSLLPPEESEPDGEWLDAETGEVLAEAPA